MSRAKLLAFKFLVSVGLALSVVVLAMMPLPGKPSSITWERDYERAIERARSEKKLIIADMFTDWCELCKKMDAETFAEPQLIKQMANKYVWLKLNTETEEDGARLQKEFSILTYPTILVLDDQGDEVDRVGRFLPSLQFMQTVESFVDGPDTFVSLKRSFQKVIELDPENREGKTDLSQYNVALCLASQEKFAEAIVQLDALETRFPRSNAVADAKVLRGQIYRCCNKLDEAQAVLREYMDKYPTHGHIEEVENLLATMEAESAR
jgi:thiol-disulfide isomerase/thioredoxin